MTNQTATQDFRINREDAINVLANQVEILSKAMEKYFAAKLGDPNYIQRHDMKNTYFWIPIEQGRSPAEDNKLCASWEAAQVCRHPSIVEFKEIVVDDCGHVFVVMDYLQNDLKRFIDVKKKTLTLSEVKCLMKQLLEGVKFLHQNGVMHRDLKPSNILMNDKGQLKICDFGLSRHFGSLSGSYTPGVVTLCYRAPELLLGANEYSCAIDMWSVGCIMAELMLKEVFFQGRSELHQLGSIYMVLGTPDDAAWPGFSSLIGSRVQFVKQPYNLLRLKFLAAAAFSGAPMLTESGFDLLRKLLTYDPRMRITAEAALNHGLLTKSCCELKFNPSQKKKFNLEEAMTQLANTQSQFMLETTTNIQNLLSQFQNLEI
ncbi:hypothetical protein Pfo_011691 [Paulownia fortunei]|nr:hypothetical protein Pfo_011691 [Paulownia fortunei]